MQVQKQTLRSAPFVPRVARPLVSQRVTGASNTASGGCRRNTTASPSVAATAPASPINANKIVDDAASGAISGCSLTRLSAARSANRSACTF